MASPDVSTEIVRKVVVGDRAIHRIGFGAMRITGPGSWGPPADPEECVKLLRHAVSRGVQLIDTADSYGPHISEELIARALHPYPDAVIIATKAGLVRTGPDEWHPLIRPAYLRQQVEMSLRRLKTDVIGLFQLHRVDDPQTPLEDAIGELALLRDEGKIRDIGICNVEVDELRRAQEITPIAAVQNAYSVANRYSEDVVDVCTAERICFMPWFPLDAGGLVQQSLVAEIARDTGTTPAQIAISWLLHSSPVVTPIPGTSSIAHLHEILGSADVTLAPEQLTSLETLRTTHRIW